MRRAAATLALLAALVAPTAATADPFTPELEADYQQALAEWGSPGGPPLCASIDKQVVPASTLAPYAGEATVPKGPGRECELSISDAPRRACNTYEVMLHEVGHLLGHEHVDDPNSVMYPDGGNGYYCQGEDLRAWWNESTVPGLRRDLKREVKRCQVVHRRACWQGVREMRRATEELKRAWYKHRPKPVPPQSFPPPVGSSS